MWVKMLNGGIRREGSDDKEVIRWYRTIKNRGFKMIYNI